VAEVNRMGCEEVPSAMILAPLFTVMV